MDEISQRAFEPACTAHDRGLLQEARRQYLLLIKLRPNLASLRYNLDLVYFQEAEFDHAINEFSLAATFEPEDIDTLFNLALCQKRTGDYAAAKMMNG